MKKVIFSVAIALMIGLCSIAFAETVIPLIDKDGKQLFVYHNAIAGNTTCFLLGGMQLGIMIAGMILRSSHWKIKIPSMSKYHKLCLSGMAFPMGWKRPNGMRNLQKELTV